MDKRYNKISEKITLDRKKINLFLCVASLACLIIQPFFALEGLDNTFPWGTYFIAAQSLAAVGDGAFIAAFLFYIFRIDSLKTLIPSCLLTSLLSNIFTSFFILLNSGQPLRLCNMLLTPAWGRGVIPDSMFTTAFFSMFICFILLCIQLVPTALTHKAFEKSGKVRTAAHYIKKLIWIPAAAFFFFAIIAHGSFGGGIWESLHVKVFWHREYHSLFITGIAAAAAGSTMLILCLISFCAERYSVQAAASMSTIAKRAFIIYCIVRAADLFLMTASLSGEEERGVFAIWGGYYGLWMLILEFCLAVASLYLLSKKPSPYIRGGTLCGVFAVITAKPSIMLQGFSIPEFPWDSFSAYLPAPIEILAIPAAVFMMIFIYGRLTKRFKIFPDTQ